MLQRLKSSTMLVISCLFAAEGYSTDPWNPDPATSIPNASAADNTTVFSSCDSSGNFLATWLDQTDKTPYYSMYNYNNSLWSSPTPIFSGDSRSYSNQTVFSSFDSSTEKFLVTWRDLTHNTIKFSLYDSSSWTNPAEIPQGVSSYSVFSSSDSQGHFLATWQSTRETLNSPYYAIYTDNPPGWSTPTPITNTITDSQSIFSSYDTATGNFFVSWIEVSTRAYWYSIYNPTSTSQWSIPAQIPNANIGGPNVFSSSDSQGNFLVTWQDDNGIATYSIYDSQGQSWSPITHISNSNISNNCDVTSSFDISTGNFLITWQDNNSSLPYYSIYNPTEPSYTAQSPVAPIIPITNLNGADIFSSCYRGSGSFIVTFVDSNDIPSYTLYSDIPRPSSPNHEFQRGEWRRRR